MKAIEQIKVSFYKNVYSKSPDELSLFLVLQHIVKGKYAESINTIRRFHDEGDAAAVARLKSGLPCFTASGTFNGAHSVRQLKEPNGILLVDIDHLAGDIERVRRLCVEDPHTVAVFRSPTDGLKVAAFVENIEGRHREAFTLVSEYYDRLTGVKCDVACKDESRLCYVSYDPDAYIAALYESFVLPAVAESDTDRFVSSYLFLNPSVKGGRNANLFKLACEACKRGYDREVIYSAICRRLAETDFTESEIANTLLSGYKKVKESVPAPGFLPASAVQTDKRTNGQYNTPTDSEGEEEGYWQGEEYRKCTPFLPEEVYENIPSLFKDCRIDDTTSRERDVLFLSCLTAFSAILPATFGVYNHDLFSPHLYTCCLAPAGSGKGVARWGAHLLKVIQERTVAESDLLAEKYKKEHREWQLGCARRAKNKADGDSPQEEPQEPPYKCFVIPATTSNTRMQMQLRDNGNMGGIIFDTEAQTMTNAGKLDCGNIDDMLCKAFGHENISSSYKANGMKPIIIYKPRLALFLTGTPEQVTPLIENAENGLTSRILFYTFREPPVWKDMGNDTCDAENYFDHYSETAYDLYRFCAEHPLRFSFTQSQWAKLNKTYGKLLAEVALENNDNLQAVVKRYAFITMRIAMILTRLDQYEHKTDSQACKCSDTYFDTAMSIVLCCYEHNRLLLTSVPPHKRYSLKNPNAKREFFNDLPDEFTREDVARCAAKYGFSERTAMRYISELIGLKVKKLSHGKYGKLL